MKKFKKLIALTCVAAMLVPTVAFAAGTDVSGEMNGDGVVENDNSPAIDITNVVLPTTTLDGDTYDFTIDAAELLADVDPENYDVDDAEGVWFKAQSADAKIEITTDADTVADYSLVEQVFEEDLSLNTISTLLNTKTDLSSLTDTYAVWVPKKDNTGNPTGDGTYLVVDTTTGNDVPDITDYFEFEFSTPNSQGGTDPEFTSVTAKPHRSENDNISNGKLYILNYVAISAEEAAAKYYDASTSALKTAVVGATLFVKNIDATNDGDTIPPSDPGETTYTQVTSLVQSTPSVGDVVFKAAEFKNQGTSSQAVVINKSTFDIKVSAKVTVSDATGLTFEAAKTDLGTDPENASIYMAIKDGTNEIAVLGETPTATATLKIAGVDPTKSTLYQTSASEDFTGSHQYYRYLDPVASYNDASFEIYAATDAGDDWDAYVEAVKAAGAAPKINVVYSWEKAGLVTEVIAAASTYSISGTNTYTIEWANSVELTDRSIKSITGGYASNDRSIFTFEESTAYTFESSSNTLTINGANGPFKEGAVGSIRYIRITFGDNSYIDLDVMCAQ